MPSFDPDFGKTGFARDLLRLRFHRLRLSQKAFAERFGLSWPSIRDQEQARFAPSAAFRLLVIAIELNPGLIERAAFIAATRPLGQYDPDEPDDQNLKKPETAEAVASVDAGRPQFSDAINEQGEELPGHIGRAREAHSDPLDLAGAEYAQQSRQQFTKENAK